MFAFAICDFAPAVPVLFVARDHFGSEALLLRPPGRRFAFASEIKALLQVPGVQAPRSIRKRLHQYLTFLWVPDPKTMFQRNL